MQAFVIRKIPPTPFSRGRKTVIAHKLHNEQHKYIQSVRLDSPLKRGLGGFYELIFRVGKLFNHYSLVRIQGQIRPLAAMAGGVGAEGIVLGPEADFAMAGLAVCILLHEQHPVRPHEIRGAMALGLREAERRQEVFG